MIFWVELWSLTDKKIFPLEFEIFGDFYLFLEKDEILHCLRGFFFTKRTEEENHMQPKGGKKKRVSKKKEDK